MERFRTYPWAAVGLGWLLVLGWLLILLRVNPGLIADEQYHFGASALLARGETPDPQTLGMPPVFHYFAAGALRILGAQLWVVRTLNALIFCGAIACFAAAATVRIRAPDINSRVSAEADSASPFWLTLLFALNPLIFPYGALAYTEPASLLAVTAAIWLLLVRKPIVCAVVLIAGCLIRQSNLAWLPLFLIWWWLDRPVRQDGAARQRNDGSVGLVSFLLAGIGAWIGLQMLGGVELGGRGANVLRFNPAQFYVFGLAVAAIWLPIWLARIPELWRTVLQKGGMQARWVAAVLAAIGALEILYQNPHPWNADPRYVRNLPLIAMDWSIAARYVVSAIVVVTALMIGLVVWRQRPRWPALLVVMFSILFLGPHFLVDPRYYQLPFALLCLTIRIRTGEALALTIWQTAGCVAICAYIAQAGDPGGGLW